MILDLETRLYRFRFKEEKYINWMIKCYERHIEEEIRMVKEIEESRIPDPPKERPENQKPLFNENI